MCEQRTVAGRHGGVKDGFHIIRRIPGRSLYQYRILFHGQEITLFQMPLIQGVQHVFRSEVQLYLSLVGCLQSGKPQLKGFGGVGHVLGRMGSQPEGFQSGIL